MVQRAVVNLFQSRRFQKFINLLIPIRFWIIVFFHAVLFAASYLLSVAVLNHGSETELHMTLIVHGLLPLVLIRLMVFYHHDLFQGMWRYVSFQDLVNIIRATIISTFLYYIWEVIDHPRQISDRRYVTEMAFCILLCGGIRLLVRNFRERYLRDVRYGKRENIILVGPVDTGQAIVKEILGDPQSAYNPIALIDPQGDRLSDNTRICDIPISSVNRLMNKQRRLPPIGSIVLCWPDASRSQISQIVDQLKPLNAEFKKIPCLNDILCEKVSIKEIKNVEIEDLLERPVVQTSLDNISATLSGKTVLVTGGGGSIGSELCRQIASVKPAKLMVLDRSEENLHRIIMELEHDFPELALHATINSINNGPGIQHLLRRHQVEIVFHAAAYKHVPLMEKVPLESAYNNIIGTYNVAQAAILAGVERFVMISTDKAVNPTNVMGVTKRIAEMVVQACNATSNTCFMTVRFGNVLGSSGSVIPIFRQQIEAGGPVTVTHPDIERFFMTITEAAQLVLQAGSMGKGGEVFVLDMGKPVKILHLAEKLISLYGKRPHVDLAIDYTGLRPGEKMYEELFNVEERLIKTKHPRIMAADAMLINPAFMQQKIRDISQVIQQGDEKVLEVIFELLVPGYQSQSVNAGHESIKVGFSEEAMPESAFQKAAEA